MENSGDFVKFRSSLDLVTNKQFNGGRLHDYDLWNLAPS
jgi:hypothetical protein